MKLLFGCFDTVATYLADIIGNVTGKYFCYAFALFVMGLNCIAAGNSWEFPGDFGEVVEGTPWQYLYVEREKPTSDAVPMDAGPDKINSVTKIKDAYFFTKDHYVMIRKAFIMPGSKHDAVLAWKSPVQGVVTFKLNIVIPKGSEKQNINFILEHRRISGGETKIEILSEKIISHLGKDDYEALLSVDDGDVISLRIGNGGDGISSDMAEVQINIIPSVNSSEVLPPCFEEKLKEAPFRPIVTIPHTVKVPVLDGKLDQNEWRGAAVLCNFQDHKIFGKAAIMPTTCYLMYDDTYLYIGFQSRMIMRKKALYKSTDDWIMKAVLDEERDPPLADVIKRDGPVWLDDSIELFFSPPGANGYYQFIGNAKGVFTDLLSGNSKWNADWRYRAAVHGDKWEGEVRIPFKELGKSVPAKGAQWHFNVCRNNQIPIHELSQWAYTGQNYLNKTEWGILRFGGTINPIAQMKPINKRDPKVPIKVGLQGAATRAQDILAYFQILHDGRLFYNDLRSICLPIGEHADIEFSGQKALLPGDYIYNLIIGNKSTGTVFDAVEFPVNIPQPFDMTLKQYPTFGKMNISIASFSSDKADGIQYLKMALFELDGKKPVETSEIKYKGQPIELPIKTYKQLTSGKYRVSCSLLDKNRVIKATQTKEFQRPARTPEWVKDISKSPAYPSLPPGFPPLTVDTDSVSCWNRKYILGHKGKPELLHQITNGNTNILETPITFILKKKNRQQKVTAGKGYTWSDKKSFRAIASQIFKSGDIKVSSKVQVDFDGNTIISLNLSSDAETDIDTFFVDIPIKKEVACYISSISPKHNKIFESLFSGVKDGLLPDRNLAEAFCTSVWLGNDSIGLSWMGIDDKDWQNDNEDRAIEILTEDKSTVTLRLRLIDIPTKLSKKPLSFQFGLMATPVKPLKPEMRTMHICNTAGWGQEVRKPEPTKLPKTLSYPMQENLDFKKGSLELWMDCDFDTQKENSDQKLFILPCGDSGLVSMKWDASKKAMRLDKGDISLLAPLSMKKNDLFHLAIAWGRAGTSIFIDGKRVADSPEPIFTTEDDITKSQLVFAGGAFNLDEIKISSVDIYEKELSTDKQPSSDSNTLLLDHLNEYFQPIDYAYPCEKVTSAAIMGGKANNGGGIVSKGCSFLPGHFGRKINLTPGVNVISVLDKIKAYGTKYMLFHEIWNHQGAGEPLREEEFKSLLRGIKELDMKLIVYFGFMMSQLVPEYDIYQWEILKYPDEPEKFYKRKYKCDPVVEYCRTLCYATHMRYFILDKMRQLIDKYDIDGVYLDGSSVPSSCSSQAHGCGYVKEGKLRQTIPYYETREMMQRIYTLWKTRKPDSLIFAHGGTAYGASSIPFVDAWMGGEIYRQNSWKNAVTIDQYRAQYVSKQWGVPFEALTWLYTRNSLALALIHDYNTVHACWPASLWRKNLALGWLWKAQDAFGMDDAVFYSYMTNGTFLQTTKGILASFYVNKKGDIWLAASQFSTDTINATLQFDTKKLRMKGELTAHDIFTGKTYPVKNGAITLDMEPWVAKVMIIEKKEM